MPDVAPTESIAFWALQVPPETEEVSVILFNTHTLLGPEIVPAPDVGSTINVAVPVSLPSNEVAV